MEPIFGLAVIVAALHVNPTQPVNTFTPGIVITHNQSGMSAGVLRNSYGDTSYLVTKEWAINERIKVGTGVISGYSVAPLLPLISLTYSVSSRLDLSYLPPCPGGNTKHGTIVTSWKF